MSTIEIERQDGIVIVRFNNPPQGCMNIGQVGELESLLDAVERDDSQRVLIFTGGIPGVFIRHYDVAELLQLAEKLRSRGMVFDAAQPVPERGLPTLIRRLEHLDKPVLAAINGHCMGGGFEFALGCDLRIAAAGDYAIGLPEVRLGILPGAGGTQRLTRLLGQAGALDFMLRGRTVPPVEAHACGLVHELVPNALTRALALAEELLQKPPLALAYIKRLVRGVYQNGFDAERTLFLDLAMRDEAIARMQKLVAGADIREL